MMTGSSKGLRQRVLKMAHGKGFFKQLTTKFFKKAYGKGFSFMLVESITLA
jgi:hypothetical protein